MSVPKYNEFFSAFLRCLSDGQVHLFKDVISFCADAFNLSEEDRAATMPSGREYLADRVGWARTYLKKAGLVETVARGELQLTAEGIRVATTEPDSVDLEYLCRYKSFREFIKRDFEDTEKPHKPGGEVVPQPGPLSPQEQIEDAINDMNKALADELMEEVMRINCYDFEKLIINLLVAMGYGSMLSSQNAVTAKSGDEGIDGVLTADKFGFDSIYIQAKQWQLDASVGRPEIQKFGGAMMGQGASKGLFITTAKFTKEAQEYAKKNLASKIVLVDGVTLAKLMIDYDIGVSTVKTYLVKKVDTDYFADFE